MEIATKGIITTKISFHKSNKYYLFHHSPKTTARQLFKEVLMHYLCKKCLECKFRKFILE